ncbi:MAG: AsmA family protein [Bryobacteraceae bacterium]
MKHAPRRRLLRAALLLLGFFLTAAAVAPFVSADSLREPLRRGLERSLQRKVQIGRVRLSLLTGPGFSLSDVVIHDDPSVGLEPLAYVTSLKARLRILSLLFGRLDFSSLHLDEPSLNLTKTERGPWNFQLLLDRQDQAPARLPDIAVSSGRINFKFGLRKSPFYLTRTNLEIFSRRNGLDFRFSGAPARTDSPAQGFGRYSGEGSWERPGSEEARLNMNVELEPSALAEVMTLLVGRDIGVHGLVSSRARLTGPITRLSVTGQLRVEDIHRWDLLPIRGRAWALNYRGNLDLWNQRLDLETVPQAKDPLPVAIRLRAADYLTQARWGVTATLKEFPVAALVEVARHMGAGLPDDFRMDGALTGAIGYSAPGGAQGQFTVQESTLALTGLSPLRLDKAEILIDDGTLSFPPTPVQLGDRHAATLALNYDPATLATDLRVNARSLPIPETLEAATRFTGAAPLDFLKESSGGEWKGTLRFRRLAAGSGIWSGQLDVSALTLPVEGLAQPVEVETAAVSIQGESLALRKMRARAGQIEALLDYSYTPAAIRPHTLRIVLDHADAAGLERLLAPTLHRRQGFLARTLGRTPSLPAFLRTRRLEGSVHIKTLTLGPSAAANVRSSVYWDGTSIEFPELTTRINEAPFAGRMTIDLQNPEPAYRVTGRLDRLKAFGGTVNLEGMLETAGAGPALLLRLTAAGYLTAPTLLLGDEELRNVAACYELTFPNGSPSLKLVTEPRP